jgi:hypothetical protein
MSDDVIDVEEKSTIRWETDNNLGGSGGSGTLSFVWMSVFFSDVKRGRIINFMKWVISPFPHAPKSYLTNPSFFDA